MNKKRGCLESKQSKNGSKCDPEPFFLFNFLNIFALKANI